MNYSIRDCLLLGLFAGFSVALLVLVTLELQTDFGLTLFEIIAHFIWIVSSYLLAAILAWCFRNGLQEHIYVWRYISIVGSFFFTTTFWLSDYIIISMQYEERVSKGISDKVKHLITVPPDFSQVFLSIVFAGIGLTIFTSIITRSIFRQRENIVHDDLHLVHKN